MKTALEYALDLAAGLNSSSRAIRVDRYGDGEITQDGEYQIERFIERLLKEITAEQKRGANP